MVRPWYWPEGGQPHRTEPFTWIVEEKMAASWWPDPPVFDIYKKQGIKVIINACEFDNRGDVPDQFHYYHINIPDYGVPTQAQVEKFLEITEKHHDQAHPIVVHCVAGCGRTGQLLVVWAAKNGYIPESRDPVAWIRNLRSCCLETEEQKQFARKMVKKFT